MFRAKLTASLTLAALTTLAHASDADELALAYGDSATISVATGSKQPLRRAPAVATVFTAEDIRAMGATDLGQVLERVPGLHLGKSFYLYDPRYLMRGIGGDLSQQILVVIDGVRRQSPTAGTPEEAWVDMPVGRIARVEVIRGPGSALYGADAFSGVISITTLGAGDVAGTRAEISAGSNAARSAQLMHGASAGEVNWMLYFRSGHTDGARRRVDVDAQTALDGVFGTQASLAPGRMNDGSDALDAALTAGWRHWTLRADTKIRRDIGSGPGLAGALSAVDRVDVRTSVLSLTYQRNDFAPGWDLYGQASLSHLTGDTHYQLYPPGAFGGIYPEGMIGKPGRSTRILASEVIGTYSGWADHRLRLGLGAQQAKVYEVRDARNFNFVLLPGVGVFPAPIGPITNVSNTGPYMPEVDRRIDFLVAQDEWRAAPDITVTAGMRYDRYSDFGSTLNPRFALVWDARHDLTLKAIAGRAFRAPTFSELYTINNPVQLGNPDLQPETISSRELAAEWQATSSVMARLNVFRYRMKDIIRLLPNTDPASGATNANLGEQRGNGFEAELVWRVNSGARLELSVSRQRGTDELNRRDVGYAPEWMLKAGAQFELPNEMNLGLFGLRIADRARGLGDTRPAVGDYTLFDLTLGWRRQVKQGWSALLGLRNATDTDAREPSPAPGAIRYDFPLPGRQFLLQAGYAF